MNGEFTANLIISLLSIVPGRYYIILLLLYASEYHRRNTFTVGWVKFLFVPYFFFFSKILSSLRVTLLRLRDGRDDRTTTTRIFGTIRGTGRRIMRNARDFGTVKQTDDSRSKSVCFSINYIF